MDFKAGLFDFDGVIFDSTPIHLRGWSHAFFELFNQPLDNATLQTLVGRSTFSISRFLAEKSGYPSSKPRLTQLKVTYVFDHIEEISLILGVKEFLSALNFIGIPYGIVSNAPRNFIEAALAKHKLEVPFFLGLEDYKRPKPDAEPFMKGAVKLGFKFTQHQHIYVFEDSTHGIKAALAAHMMAIGIGSQHSLEILQKAGASQSFLDFKEARLLLNL